jgi:hypothetical protein
MLHVALLLVSLTALPIALPRGWDPPASSSVIPWLLAFLAVSLGLPFFALAATAPLVQHWLARLDDSTETTGRKDPYVLYAASNAGSLLGLLAFPFLLERQGGCRHFILYRPWSDILWRILEIAKLPFKT